LFFLVVVVAMAVEKMKREGKISSLADMQEAIRQANENLKLRQPPDALSFKEGRGKEGRSITPPSLVKTGPKNAKRRDAPR